MKIMNGIRRHPIQWIVFSGLAYLFIGIFVGGYFHKGPLIQSGDQFADIPLWANVILIVLSAGIGAYTSHKENKA
ncbi:hypothetical protein [Pseudomonas fluorescens group sp. PF-69]